MGRGTAAPKPDRGYIKLLLERVPNREDKYLIALETTADFYGWTSVYPIWEPKSLSWDTSGRYAIDPGRKGQLYMQGGRQHRICRSTSHQGNPRGKTNKFKLSHNCCLRDIAELAHLTRGDWCWMTGPNFKPVDRAQWEALSLIHI